MRDAVFKVLKGFLSKVEKVSEDPSLREQMGKSMGVVLVAVVIGCYDWTVV